jgi:hypothetical protein
MFIIRNLSFFLLIYKIIKLFKNIFFLIFLLLIFKKFIFFYYKFWQYNGKRF